MTVVIISLFILAAGLIATTVGKIWLSYYAFKYGAGMGILVLAFDIGTFWFAFYKLEKEGKEMMTAMWMGGIVLSAVALLGFYGPIEDGLTGEAWTQEYAISHASGPVDSVVQGRRGTVTKPEEAKPEEAKPEAPAVTVDAGVAPAVGADAGAAATADAAPAPAEGSKAAPAAADGAKPAPTEAAPATP